jgi:8-oxo-dGTP diphosphatase
MHINNNRFLVRSAAYLILIKDRKILLLRRFNTGWMDGKYSFVVGHLDGGETVTQAIMREAREEARITVDEKDLHVVHVMHRKSGDKLEYIDFFLVADKWEGIPEIGERDKCDEMEWYSLDDLPNDILPYIAEAIHHVKNKIIYSEFGWEK